MCLCGAKIKTVFNGIKTVGLLLPDFDVCGPKAEAIIHTRLIGKIIDKHGRIRKVRRHFRVVYFWIV
jgi:UPF0288 family protein (methanogenesis marker protein 3)